MQLAVFDLDHTLLSGDSDRLWCDFLVDLGWLDADWRERCVRIADGCAAGTIAPQAYCDFHASTLAGREPAALLPLRQRFLAERVRPRIPDDARALLRRHADEGHRVVLTTATSRVVSEFTARELGIDDHLATEVEVIDGRYTGRAVAPPNMRMGKVDRLRRWLAEQGAPETALQQAFFYSDSINDLPLLSVVRHTVVVDPDRRLESTARRKGWSVLRLRR